MAKILSTQVGLTVAGTAYKLGTGNVNQYVMFKALTINTGVVYVGNNGNNTVSSNTGMPLSSGQAVVVYVDDLDNWWANGTVNGDKVSVLLLGS